MRMRSSLVVYEYVCYAYKKYIFENALSISYKYDQNIAIGCILPLNPIKLSLY